MDNGLKWGGITATALYLLAGAGYVLCSWDKFVGLDPNAVGDFLAGAFSPLAFLWLVLGFFQQGKELKQNNEALRLQAAELKNSVEQQRELVSVTREQVAADLALMKDERDRRIASLAPKFVLDMLVVNSSDVDGSGFIYGKLRNIGNNVTDVLLVANREGVASTADKRPAVLHSEQIDANFTVVDMEDFGDFTLDILYVDQSGTPGVQSIDLCFVPKTLHRMALLVPAG